MKKLYNHNKRKIHPSPPPSTTTDNHLSLLPIAIATLAAALSPEDKEVLAYLLSCSLTTTTTTAAATANNNNKKFSGDTKPTGKTGGGNGDGFHPPQFRCNCFTCYTSYWVRWDASPNRQVIHEIIDAYEDEIINNNKNGKNKKEKRKKKVSNFSSSFSSSNTQPTTKVKEVKDSYSLPQVEKIISDHDDYGHQNELSKGSSSTGSVRKIVSFIGERIWGVWGV